MDPNLELLIWEFASNECCIDDMKNTEKKLSINEKDKKEGKKIVTIL